MTHDEFAKLKNEIAEALVDKTKRELTNSFLKWSSLFITAASVIVSYTLFHVITDQVEEDINNQIEEGLQEAESARKKMIDGIYELDRRIRDYSDASDDLSEIIEQHATNLENSNGLIVQLNWAREIFSSVLPIVLPIRDQLLGEAAGFASQPLGIDQTNGNVVDVAANANPSFGPPKKIWGQRKIVIVRETPSVATGEDLSAGQQVYDAKIESLSSRLRIAFAVMGYEVDEWDVSREQKPIFIRQQFAIGIEELNIPNDRPAIIGHPRFDSTYHSVDGIVRHLSDVERMSGLQPLLDLDFTPDPALLESLNGGQQRSMAFEPTEVLIIILPWEVARQLG